MPTFDYKIILRSQSVDKAQKKGVSIMLTPCLLLTFRCRVSDTLVKTLFNTSRLTSTLTQVVQFGFTHSATTFNSDAVNYR